ncbi:hypothetical protein D3C71_2109400 [compost metagenome]
MLMSGFRKRPTPSAVSMLFWSRRSCGWVSISNCSVTAKSWASSRPTEISLSGLFCNGSPMARQAWVKTSIDWWRGT